jgi:integrative and conjugative element protein (TIGR02256 family)
MSTLVALIAPVSKVGYTIWVKESAYRAILEEAIGKMPFETGGVLLGYWGNEREAVVTMVVGPGPHAVHKKRSFVPDNEFHLGEIAKQYDLSDRTETYLGDWHTHPKARAYLSWQDEATLKRIAAFRPARLQKPCMMILGTCPVGLGVWVHSNEEPLFFKRKKISKAEIKIL